MLSTHCVTNQSGQHLDECLTRALGVIQSTVLSSWNWIWLISSARRSQPKYPSETHLCLGTGQNLNTCLLGLGGDFRQPCEGYKDDRILLLSRTRPLDHWAGLVCGGGVRRALSEEWELTEVLLYVSGQLNISAVAIVIIIPMHWSALLGSTYITCILSCILLPLVLQWATSCDYEFGSRRKEVKLRQSSGTWVNYYYNSRHMRRQ